MQRSLLNNLCNDNDVHNHLRFFTLTNFVKNNPVERLIGGCPLKNLYLRLKENNSVSYR